MDKWRDFQMEMILIPPVATEEPEPPDPYLTTMDKDPLHLEISPFVHFMVQILFHKSNDI